MTVRRRGIVLVAAFTLVPSFAGADIFEPCTLPKGTHVTIRLAVPISSTDSRTGEIFGFSLVDDISAPGCTVPADGAQGLGTVFLSGASGSDGHEGDLTIRLDTIRTRDTHYVVFDDQRMRINGKNRKIESALLGFVPFAGYASGLIRGSDVHLDEKTPINTVLDRPASVTAVAPTFVPQNAPSVGPTPLPQADDSPTVTTPASPSPMPTPPATKLLWRDRTLR